MRIGGISFEVIGFLTPKMQEGNDNINTQVYIPFTTMSDLKDTYYLNGIFLDYEGMEYEKVEYQVRVIIGPADLRFELWFDNQKLSRDQSIRVDWAPAPTMPPPPVMDIATYNRVELPDSHPGGAGWGTQGIERTATGMMNGNGTENGSGSSGGEGKTGRGGRWKWNR